MAEKEPKSHPQRTFVDASSGQKIETPVAAATVHKQAGDAPQADPAGAGKFRIGAVVLWIVGIAFEVLAILFMAKKLYLPPNSMVWMIGSLIVDCVCVVIGSQLWKKANHMDPASEANKTKFFIQNQLGAIISVLAFLPFIILVLINKDADKNTKLVATIVAVVALAISGVSSIDTNPVSSEDLAQEQQMAETYAVDGNVYWTTFGTVYHLDPDCSHIINSGTIYSGSIAEATDAGRSRLCSTCEQRAAAGEISTSAAANQATGSASTPAANQDSTDATATQSESNEQQGDQTLKKAA